MASKFFFVSIVLFCLECFLCDHIAWIASRSYYKLSIVHCIVEDFDIHQLLCLLKHIPVTIAVISLLYQFYWQTIAKSVIPEPNQINEYQVSFIYELKLPSKYRGNNLTKSIVIRTITGTVMHIKAVRRQDTNAPNKKSANAPNDPNKPALASNIAINLESMSHFERE